MSTLVIREIDTAHTPESLAERLQGEPGLVLLRSGMFEAGGRFSFVAARPFLRFCSYGSRCEVSTAGRPRALFGDPWRLLESLLARYELLEEVDLPFPLGGCFGFWGYELKDFVEPGLPRRAVNDLELPDCHVGFYDSLVAFDPSLGKTWIISTGLDAQGERCEQRARSALDFWKRHLESLHTLEQCPTPPCGSKPAGRITSSMSRKTYLRSVEKILDYIHQGDIYQANLTHRLCARMCLPVWTFFRQLSEISPAPFSGFLDCGGFQLASSSPELFLRLSGRHVTTRPIKGTRPRGATPDLDARLGFELQTSEKEMAELVMITDLLRNDLGRICEYGSVQAPDLARLERYPQVQHLVSTVEGQLRPGLAHLEAMASCFPGGSITGAPKIRAMEIIDQLESVTRGPYTGCMGYLGFNQESQLNILIRTAVCRRGEAWFHVGAGIVADSDPVAEYRETLAKAGGFLRVLNLSDTEHPATGVEWSAAIS